MLRLSQEPTLELELEHASLALEDLREGGVGSSEEEGDVTYEVRIVEVVGGGGVWGD